MSPSSPSEEQAQLFEFESECGLLLPPEEQRKVYTAQQVSKLERVYHAVCLLLGAGWPVSVIARELHMQMSTVQAIAMREAEKVSQNGKEMAEILNRSALRWTALARTKELDASFKDLLIGAGIAMQNARDLAAMGQLLPEKETKELDQDHQAAAEALRRMMEVDQVDQAGSPSVDSVSTVSTLNSNDLQQIPSIGAGHGAGEDPQASPVPSSDPQSERLGPGGGPAPGGGPPDPIHPSIRGMSPKGPTPPLEGGAA